MMNARILKLSIECQQCIYHINDVRYKERDLIDKHIAETGHAVALISENVYSKTKHTEFFYAKKCKDV